MYSPAQNCVCSRRVILYFNVLQERDVLKGYKVRFPYVVCHRTYSYAHYTMKLSVPFFFFIF